MEYITIQNSKSIELQTETDPNGDWIIGFTVFLKGVIEAEVLTEADRQAKHLADILAVKRGIFVTCHQSGYTKKTASGWTTTAAFTSSYRIHAHVQIDLRDPKIAALIATESDTTQQLHHYNLALRAEGLGQYEGMITELFKVIEKEKTIPAWSKYKALRDALSHQKPVPHAKSNIDLNFGLGYFDFIVNDEFDHNSPKNMRNLRAEALALQSIITSYVTTKI